MKNWFVLQTKPLKEIIVAKLLGEAGIKTYCPQFKDDNGRPHMLFPCYEFVYFDFPSQYRLIHYTRGVRRVLGNEHGPIALAEEIVEEIRAREVDGFIVLEDELGSPEPGDIVEVVKGPLRGFRGIFKKTLSSEERVLILLNYINYEGKVIVPRAHIKKAKIK